MSNYVDVSNFVWYNFISEFIIRHLHRGDNMYKKIIAMALSICISIQLFSAAVYAQENTTETSYTVTEEVSDFDNDVIDAPIAVSFKDKTVVDIIEQSKFRAHQGHGFAAERGNNLADKIKGKNTIVVGDNNVKNGPDRLIINRDGTNILIQDKYYQTAKAGIDACFDNSGKFRYIDGDGNPMLIEVPADQYDDAVMYMREKIKSGKIPNISDPDEASTLVKKGALTYKQAKNLAKAGNIDSLKYDAANGTVSAVSAFGISAVVNFAVNKFNGVSTAEALKSSAIEGLKTGGMAFGSYVISAQLSKTGIMEVFRPSSEALVRTFGDDFANALIQSTGKTGVKLTAEQATQQAAKILRSNALISTVTVVVFSIPDAIDLFQGRISKKQFIKNFAVTAVSVVAGAAGGYVGGALGNLIVPGVGTVPGAVVGSLLFGVAGGWGADVISDYITDDDAEEMYVIV